MVTKMSKFLFSFFFALSICLNSFAVTPFSKQGTLYFPIAWEIKSKEPINPAQFASSTITFQNTKTGAKFTQPFDTKSIIENQDKQGVIFFAPKITTPPSGSYDLVTMGTKYQNGQNAVDLNTRYPISYTIIENKVTVMGGVFVHSEFNGKSAPLNTNPVIKLNQLSMGYDTVVNDLKSGKIFSDSNDVSQIINSINFSNTSSPQLVREFPTQPPTHNSSNLAHYGVAINMPCSFSGVSEIVFQRETEPVYYSKSMPINPKKCLDKSQNIALAGTGEYPNPINIFLNAGKWTINKLAEASLNDLTALGFDVINQPTLLNYYQTNKMDFLKHNASFKIPNRNFSFTVQNDMISKPFFYIGAFEWQIDSKNQATLFFARKYFLVDLRKLFGSQQIFNGYNGKRMMSHQVLGSISVFFREVNVSKVNKTDLQKFEKTALTDLTTCLQNSDKTNPLLLIDGQILFYNDPKNVKRIGNEIKIPDSYQSNDDIRNCLATQFKNLPVINNEFSINAEISSL